MYNIKSTVVWFLFAVPGCIVKFGDNEQYASCRRAYSDVRAARFNYLTGYSLGAAAPGCNEV